MFLASCFTAAMPDETAPGTRTLLLCHGRAHGAPWRRQLRRVETMDVDRRSRPHYVRDVTTAQPLEEGLAERFDLVVGVHPPYTVLWTPEENDEDASDGGVRVQTGTFALVRDLLRPGGLFVTTLAPVPDTGSEFIVDFEDCVGTYSTVDVPYAVRTLGQAASAVGLRMRPVAVHPVSHPVYPTQAFDGFMCHTTLQLAPTAYIDVSSRAGREEFLARALETHSGEDSADEDFDLRAWVAQKRLCVVAFEKAPPLYRISSV